MAPVVVFPDAVAVTRTGLVAGLPALRDATKVTERHPGKGTFVLLDRTGGVRGSLVHDEPQITADSYAPDLLDAERLAAHVRAVINAMAGTTVAGVPIYRVTELGGPGRLFDPVHELDFYRQSFAIGMRGATP